jgi:uncharacterized protein (DUF58 family)
MTLSDRTRRRVAFTREGWSFVAILAFVVFGSILRQINLLVMLASMMIPALLFNWRMVISMIRRLGVKHSVAPWVFAGQTTVVELEVQNQSKTFTAWNVLLTDSLRRVGPWDDETPSRTIDLVAVSVEPQHQTHISYRCSFGERGIYRLGPVVVSCQYPFGLVSAWFQQLDTTELYVAPRLGQLEPTWNKRLDALAVGLASAARRRGWLPDEFYGLRNWQQGDTTRAIHWRSTAKRGQLVVKQFDQPTDRDFALALDLFVPAHSDSDTHEATELAASFVATVMSRINYAIHGRMAVAICGAQSRLFTNQVGGEFVRSVMQELAIVQPSMQPEIAQYVVDLAGRVSPGTPIIVVTTRRPEEREALMLNSPAIESSADWQANVLWIHIDSPEFREMFTPAAASGFSGMPVDNALIIGPDADDA